MYIKYKGIYNQPNGNYSARLNLKDGVNTSIYIGTYPTIGEAAVEHAIASDEWFGKDCWWDKLYHQVDHELYFVWHSMISRCRNRNYPNYKNWGGRGITVCRNWKLSFSKFLADMGERPEGLTLDRIDNDGNYEPSNCRWTNRFIQNRNTRKQECNSNGTSFIKKTGRYRVYMSFQKKQMHIGTFSTLEEAIKARKEAEKKHW